MQHLKIATVKGFVYGVNWQSDDIQNYVKHLSLYDVIVWDGDLFKPDSFTYLIKQLMEQFPEKKYIAHKKETSVHKLSHLYQEDDHGVIATGYDLDTLQVHKMDASLKWNELGVRGLIWLLDQYPGEQIDVIFFGQGDFAKQEEEVMKQYDRVNIIKYHVVR